MKNGGIIRLSFLFYFRLLHMSIKRLFPDPAKKKGLIEGFEEALETPQHESPCAFITLFGETKTGVSAWPKPGLGLNRSYVQGSGQR